MSTDAGPAEQVPTDPGQLADLIRATPPAQHAALRARFSDEQGQLRAGRVWQRALRIIERRPDGGAATPPRVHGPEPLGDGPANPPKWRPGAGQWGGLHEVAARRGGDVTINLLVREAVDLLLAAEDGKQPVQAWRDGRARSTS